MHLELRTELADRLPRRRHRLSHSLLPLQPQLDQPDQLAPLSRPARPQPLGTQRPQFRRSVGARHGAGARGTGQRVRCRRPIVKQGVHLRTGESGVGRLERLVCLKGTQERWRKGTQERWRQWWRQQEVSRREGSRRDSTDCTAGVQVQTAARRGMQGAGSMASAPPCVAWRPTQGAAAPGDPHSLLPKLMRKWAPRGSGQSTRPHPHSRRHSYEGFTPPGSLTHRL